MPQENDDLFIGLDFGGTALKSVLYNRNGDTLAAGYAVIPRPSTHPGWQELDMNSAWEAAKDALKEVVKQAGTLVNHIRVIGVTGAGHGAWLIDKDGSPLRNGILWTDERGEDLLAEFIKSGIGDRYYQITGSALIKSNTAILLKWFSIHEPEILEKAATVFMPQEWIHYRLSGDARTDCTGASITVGDVHTNKYSEELLQLFGLEKYRHLFPPIRSTFETTGYILPEVAKEVGLPLTVEINNAPDDITSCTVGVGNIQVGDAYSCLGTGLGSLFITKELELDHFLNAQTMAIDTPDVKYVHSVLPIFGSPNQDWFIRSFCAEDKILAEQENISVFDYLAQKVAAIPAGAEGLLYNPFICPFGLSLPFTHRTDTTHFIGLNQRHTRYHMLRALYEGVAYAIRRAYETSGLTFQGTILSGGGARSNIWCQIISDVLGLPIKVPADEECGAKGAAINAAYAGGYFRTHSEAVYSMVHYDRRFTPDETKHQKYNKLYALFQEVYERLIPIWDQLDAIKREPIAK